MNVLLVYYHPVTFDIAQAFKKLGYNIDIAINTNIKDNYGKGVSLLKQNKEKYKDVFNVVPLAAAIFDIKRKKYELVGCDGVFDGDQLVMESCKSYNVPYFNIQGYPNVVDEPSDNILSLGWFTPTVQYLQKYPHEGHKKQIDWKNIAENNKSDGKNICIFYPPFFEFKEQVINYDLPFKKSNFISLIQGYEKWNPWSYKAFQKIEQKINVKNLEGKPIEDVFFEILNSSGLIHLKWSDNPGIAIFEAMLMGRPVLTMKSFVLASMNQEVLIDGYNAVVADDLWEIVEASRDLKKLSYLGRNARKHANMLTDFDRQKDKLTKFIERCLNDTVK